LHGSPVGDSLTISAGIACYPSHALNAPELVDQAGRALEAARARGRDHVEIAQPD
jgi:GGDEF domain-containing protein